MGGRKVFRSINNAITQLDSTRLERDGGATDVNETVELVVCAADGLLSTVSTLTNTNEGDGSATKTDEASDIAEDDTEKTQEGGDGAVAG